jgi:hypothetical protein
MEIKELKREAQLWYETISRNSVARVTKSKKFPNTVAVAVKDPNGKSIGYVWVSYSASDNALLLKTEFGTHGMKALSPVKQVNSYRDE